MMEYNLPSRLDFRRMQRRSEPCSFVYSKPQVAESDSFKTLRDSAGNIQLTFAKNAEGALLADIDLDDHKGLAHVADVLKRKFSGKDTDPYDIQQILRFFQQLDAEYQLL